MNHSIPADEHQISFAGISDSRRSSRQWLQNLRRTVRAGGGMDGAESRPVRFETVPVGTPWSTSIKPVRTIGVHPNYHFAGLLREKPVGPTHDTGGFNCRPNVPRGSVISKYKRTSRNTSPRCVVPPRPVNASSVPPQFVTMSSLLPPPGTVNAKPFDSVGL